MTSVTFSEARNNLKSFIDLAVDDCEVVHITRKNAEDAVLISKAEWDSIQETLWIMSDPERMERLQKSIREMDEGKVHAYSSVEELHAAAEKRVANA